MYNLYQLRDSQILPRFFSTPFEKPTGYISPTFGLRFHASLHMSRNDTLATPGKKETAVISGSDLWRETCVQFGICTVSRRFKDHTL